MGSESRAEHKSAVVAALEANVPTYLGIGSKSPKAEHCARGGGGGVRGCSLGVPKNWRRRESGAGSS